MPEIYQQEGYNHKVEYDKWEQLTKYQLTSLKPGKYYKIPPITHSVYCTDESNPKPMKEIYIEYLFASAQFLRDADKTFQHILWVNFDHKDNKYQDIIPGKIKHINNLEIRNLAEFENHKLYSNYLNFIKKGNPVSKYTEASDVARGMAMQKYGGIYFDLDARIYNADPLISYMKTFDFMGGKEVPEWKSSIGNAFFAAKANHTITNKYVELMYRNLNQDQFLDVPDYIKFPAREFDRVIYTTGPIAITVAYVDANNMDGNIDIAFPQKMTYDFDFARSFEEARRNNRELPKTNSLLHKWNDIEIQAFIADQFSGSWVTTLLEDIAYHPKDLAGKIYTNTVPIKYSPTFEEIINSYPQPEEPNDFYSDWFWSFFSS